MAKKIIKITILIAVLVAALAIPSAASAAGACGGGKTFNQMYNGWKKKGVLDDVYRTAGIKPGVDAAKGKASKALLKKAFTRKRVVKGTSRARNTDCRGSRFVGLRKRARQSSGTYVWVLKDDIRKGGVVKTWWAADCGNKRGGRIKVHTPGKKPPKKSKPPKKTSGKYVCANTGEMVDSIQQCVTQTNTASQNCEAGQIWNGTQCTIVQVNNNCGNTSVGNGNTTTGDNCNVVNVCSNVNSPGGVVNCSNQPCTTNCITVCPDGSALPCDEPPTGEIDASAAHLQTSNDPTAPSSTKRVQLYFIGDDPDGDNIVLDILLDAPAGTYVSGKTKVTQFSDPNRTCPSDQTCWEATLWSGNTPGEAKVRGKFTAGGEYFTTEPVSITVAADTFPQN